jgi:hypothetical protein
VPNTATTLLDTVTFNKVEALYQEEEDYEDAYSYVDYSLDDSEPEDNDEYQYGGYGSHFDSYSTFDSNDYEYQQGLYL